MFAFAKNIGIGTKTAIAPAIFFISLVVVGAVCLTSLATINNSVKSISEDLAKDAITANKLLDEIYRKRIAMKNFLQTSDDYHANAFQRLSNSMRTLLVVTEQEIQAPERRVIVSELVTLNARYDKLLKEQLVPSQHRQQTLYDEDIYVSGKSARESLTQIMTTAYEDDDAVSAYFAGIAQSHLLLARLYASKYVVSENTAFYERAKNELLKTNASMQRLDTELQNPKRRSLLTDSLQQIGRFSQSVDEIYAVLQQRKATVAEMDEIGTADSFVIKQPISQCSFVY